MMFGKRDFLPFSKVPFFQEAARNVPVRQLSPNASVASNPYYPEERFTETVFLAILAALGRVRLFTG